MPIDPKTLLIAAAALAAVLATIFVSARIARATGLARPPGTKRLIVKEALQLDRTRRVYLIGHDDAELLLLTGGPTDLAWRAAGPTALSLEPIP